jgi:hypothetical protein
MGLRSWGIAQGAHLFRLLGSFVMQVITGHWWLVAPGDRVGARPAERVLMVGLTRLGNRAC